MAKFRFIPIAAVFGLLSAGCSTHPIPEDVTGLTVYDITNKIRCEAREVLEAGLNAMPGRLETLAMLRREQAALERAIANENAVIHAKLPQFVAEREELAAQQRFVDAALEERAVQLLAWAKAVQSNAPRPFSRAKAERLFEELKGFERSREKNNAKTLNFNARLSLFERDRLTKARQLAARRAEFERRFAKPLRFLGNTFAYALRFEIEETNDARVNTADIIRAVTLGTVTVGLAAGEKKLRKGTREVRVAAKFTDLLKLKEECAAGRYFVDESGVHALRYPIRGRIGLDEVINQYLKLVESEFAFSTEASGGKTYISVIRFTTTVDGSVKPATALTQPSRHRFNSNGVLSAQRQDVHEATIVIVPPDRVTTSTIASVANLSVEQGEGRKR